MLKTETVTYSGKEYIRTWSDEGKMVERDGDLYEEAIDPAELGRTYVETDQPIEHESEATEADYQNALREMGVDV